MYLREIIIRTFKSILLKTPMKEFMVYRYLHYFRPEELCFLIRCVNETKDISGNIVEIGCAIGRTTVFLNKHMDAANIDKKYICIDTFSGFTEKDISYEIHNRKKHRGDFMGFKANSVNWFHYTLQLNNIERVKIIKSDIKKYNFNPKEKISFCLIDVDLYQPIKSALEKIYGLLQPGGIILVDDCWEQNYLYDSAVQAYKEFVEKKGLKKDIVLNRFGLIRKA